jgi:hypothetical protein
MLDQGVAEQPGLGWAAAARGWCRPGRRRVSCQRPSWWQTGQVRRLARRSQRAWVRALVSRQPQVGQLAIQMPAQQACDLRRWVGLAGLEPATERL